MKNLEPIARLYFLMFAGVTGLIILMLFCGCNPANGIDTRDRSGVLYLAKSSNGDYGGAFIFDAKSRLETNEFDVFEPVNTNGRWIRLDRTCDAKAYSSPFDGYPIEWR